MSNPDCSKVWDNVCLALLHLFDQKYNKKKKKRFLVENLLQIKINVSVTLYNSIL